MKLTSKVVVRCHCKTHKNQPKNGSVHQYWSIIMMMIKKIEPLTFQFISDSENRVLHCTSRHSEYLQVNRLSRRCRSNLQQSCRHDVPVVTDELVKKRNTCLTWATNIIVYKGPHQRLVFDYHSAFCLALWAKNRTRLRGTGEPGVGLGGGEEQCGGGGGEGLMHPIGSHPPATPQPPPRRIYSA